MRTIVQMTTLQVHEHFDLIASECHQSVLHVELCWKLCLTFLFARAPSRGSTFAEACNGFVDRNRYL